MSGIEVELISHLVFAGNTTMTHLVLGLDPKYIMLSPYTPTSNFIPPVRAINIGLNVKDHVFTYIFPGVASYVGGDIVAGVLGSGIFQRDEVTLFIDVGTNGEIVIGNKDWLTCTSCSAGPAFEGGGIKFGMRAGNGAIEQVKINPSTYEPMILTIGRTKPAGICGSGLIDVVAELFEAGVIDQNAKFNRDLPTARVREGESGWEYVLSFAAESQIGRDIVLTEVDLDNLIRAKAAIYAGCKTLLDSVGLRLRGRGEGHHRRRLRPLHRPGEGADDRPPAGCAGREVSFCRQRLPAGRPVALFLPGAPEADRTDRKDHDEHRALE